MTAGVGGPPNERWIYEQFDERRQENDEKFDAMRAEFKAEFVTRTEFAPVKTVVYGLVGLMLMAMGGAIAAGVLKAPTSLPAQVNVPAPIYENRTVRP